MTKAAAIDTPVIILASRGSRGSYLAALLGAHPALHGAPHLNLLAFEQGWQYLTYCAAPRDTNVHGLLRFLGQTLLGEQTVQSIQAARRWFNVRRDRDCVDIHAELASLVAPARLVDYSPLHAQNLETMRRVAARYPRAAIIHLVASPRVQGVAAMHEAWQTLRASQPYWRDRGANHPCMDAYELGEQLVDWSVTPPVFDPQFAWYRTQNAARKLFDELPAGRGLRLTTESLMADPAAALTRLLPHLDLAADAGTIADMVADRDRLYSMPGPYAVTSGVDLDMVGHAVADLRDQPVPEAPLDPSEPLFWRGDNDVFHPRVMDLARELGYLVGGENMP